MALISMLSIWMSASLMLASAHGPHKAKTSRPRPPAAVGGFMCSPHAASHRYIPSHSRLGAVVQLEDFLVEFEEFCGQFLGQVTSY